MALHRESTVATQNTTLFFKALSSSKQFLFAFRARGNLSFLFYCYVWELWQNMISCAWTLMSPGFRRMWKISILFSLQILSSFKQKKRGKKNRKFLVRSFTHWSSDKLTWVPPFVVLKKVMLTFNPQDFLCYGYRLFSLGS